MFIICRFKRSDVVLAGGLVHKGGAAMSLRHAILFARFLDNEISHPGYIII